MRKPRDYDAEMQALNDRTKQLKERKVQQLGELVIACSADALPVGNWPARCSPPSRRPTRQ